MAEALAAVELQLVQIVRLCRYYRW